MFHKLFKRRDASGEFRLEEMVSHVKAVTAMLVDAIENRPRGTITAFAFRQGSAAYLDPEEAERMAASGFLAANNVHLFDADKGAKIAAVFAALEAAWPEIPAASLSAEQ